MGFSCTADSMPSGSAYGFMLRGVSFDPFGNLSICCAAVDQLNAAAPQVLGEDGHRVVAWRKLVNYLCLQHN